MIGCVCFLRADTYSELKKRRNTHRSCFVKMMYLILQYSQESTLVKYLFSKAAGLKA